MQKSFYARNFPDPYILPLSRSLTPLKGHQYCSTATVLTCSAERKKESGIDGALQLRDADNHVRRRP